MREFSQEEIDEFEEQLEDTDVKALLIQQNAYLDAILRTLEGAEAEEEPTLYECVMCGEKVPESKRQYHLEKEHSAPPNMELEGQFNPV